MTMFPNHISTPQVVVDGMHITKFLLQETGKHHDQWRRVYKTELTGDVQMALEHQLAGERIFTPATVAGVAGQFIKVGAQPEKQIAIPNGFGERRIRFLLEVQKVDIGGGKVIEVISGYSDAFDVSHGGHLNPDLVFNINSIMMINERTEYTPMGPKIIRTINNNSHLLYDRSYQGVGGVRDAYLRPQDVYGIMSLNDLGGVLPNNSFDARNVMMPIPQKSSRSNGLATTYMAKTLGGIYTAHAQNDLSATPIDVYSQAKGNVTESNAGMDSFLNAIRQIKRAPSIDATFTIRQLEAMDYNGVNNPAITRFQMFGQAEHISSDARQYTQVVSGADLNTQIATIIMQSVSAIAMELSFTKIAFQATNRTNGMNFGIGLGLDLVTITNYRSFADNVDMSPNIAMFEQRLKTEVLRDLSNNGNTDYDITVDLDVLNEAVISVSVYGGQSVPYRFPTYCDALNVPMVTGNTQLVHNIASDFSAATDLLREAAGRPATVNFNTVASF